MKISLLYLAFVFRTEKVPVLHFFQQVILDEVTLLAPGTIKKEYPASLIHYVGHVGLLTGNDGVCTIVHVGRVTLTDAHTCSVLDARTRAFTEESRVRVAVNLSRKLTIARHPSLYDSRATANIDISYTHTKCNW
jgi:hypothetical protein